MQRRNLFSKAVSIFCNDQCITEMAWHRRVRNILHLVCLKDVPILIQGRMLLGVQEVPFMLIRSFQQRKFKSKFQKESDLHYDSALQDSDITMHVLPDF